MQTEGPDQWLLEHTLAISLESSIMDWEISGMRMRFCIAFITSVLLLMEPAMRSVAGGKGEGREGGRVTVRHHSHTHMLPGNTRLLTELLLHAHGH